MCACYVYRIDGDDQNLVGLAIFGLNGATSVGNDADAVQAACLMPATTCVLACKNIDVQVHVIGFMLVS